MPLKGNSDPRSEPTRGKVIPSSSSQLCAAQAQEPNKSDGDEKIAVNSEFSSLPEVVPHRPVLGSHQHYSPYLNPNNYDGGFSAHNTPIVSPITPESNAGSVYGGGRPSVQTPWSPGYFETLNPVSLDSLHAPLKPPPSYEYGEALSPHSSQTPLAPGMYSPGHHGPSHDGHLHPGIGMPAGPAAAAGLGPVALARRRRRRRLWIMGGVCFALLLCIIAAIVGVLLGVVHIQIKKNNGSGVSVRRVVLLSELARKGLDMNDAIG